MEKQEMDCGSFKRIRVLQGWTVGLLVILTTCWFDIVARRFDKRCNIVEELLNDSPDPAKTRMFMSTKVKVHCRKQAAGCHGLMRQQPQDHDEHARTHYLM